MLLNSLLDIDWLRFPRQLNCSRALIVPTAQGKPYAPSPRVSPAVSFRLAQP